MSRNDVSAAPFAGAELATTLGEADAVGLGEGAFAGGVAFVGEEVLAGEAALVGVGVATGVPGFGYFNLPLSESTEMLGSDSTDGSVALSSGRSVGEESVSS